MSVLKRFRSESKMQFYATAQKLRKDIMTLLLKDFGVRSKVRQLDIKTRRMTTDDRNAFLAIAERYGITAAEAEFPAWLIDFERQSLADLTRRLVLSVTAANSIYPTAFAAGLHLLQDTLFLYQRRQAPDAACERDFHA